MSVRGTVRFHPRSFCCRCYHYRCRAQLFLRIAVVLCVCLCNLRSVDASEVVQGALGDCWLAAALSIVTQQPLLLHALFAAADIRAGGTVSCMHCSLCTTPLLALLESPCSPLLCSALFSYPLTQHNMVCVQCTPFGCSMRAVGASSWSMITSPSLSNMVALFSLTPNHARSSGCQCSRRPSRSYTAHTHPCELSQPAHCTTTISSSAYNS